MKINKKILILTTLMIFLPVIYGLLHWHELPNPMPTHWGINGIPDGYSSKEFAVFGLPAILALIHVVCCFAHKLDPKSHNYSDKLFAVVLWLCPAISIICSYMTYAYALGNELNVPQITTSLMGFVFVIVGNYMPKVKQNYTMGIKLPWTLNDEDNWYKTHKLAGIIWLIAGIAIIICSFLNIFKAIVVIMTLAVFIPVIYSYAIYKEKEPKEDAED